MCCIDNKGRIFDKSSEWMHYVMQNGIWWFKVKNKDNWEGGQNEKQNKR
ncbi:hypothetical protein CLOSBL3_12579 [Clostridiaceae bacterium BL-3]|nr:hypothetical protein CLOSBL3_12579 [Clostridiaceae bacterium BL-3]